MLLLADSLRWIAVPIAREVHWALLPKSECQTGPRLAVEAGANDQVSFCHEQARP